jgi:putative hydrolase of the HAD superfamily
MLTSKPKWIFFDIGGTLLEIRRPMTEIIIECAAEAGFEVAPAAAKSSVKQAIAQLPSRHPSYVNLTENRRWWLGFFEDALAGVAASLGVRPAALLPVCDALWERHRRGDNLRLFPDAVGLIERLRGCGFRLGVISNWDDTLPDILRRDALLDDFEFLAVSCEVRSEKPETAIFDYALRHSRARPEACLHVGDDWRCDVFGAARMGIRPAWIRREMPAAVAQAAQPDDCEVPIAPMRLSELSELADFWR